jgi:dihydrofolate reductase
MREDNLFQVSDFDELDVLLKSLDGLHEKVYYIGGTRIYQEAFNRGVDNIYKTVVHGNYECDTFFPKEIELPQPEILKVADNYHIVRMYK